MILFKQADVYAPEYLGVKDVLVCGGKIEAVGDNLEGGTGCQVIDAKGMRLTCLLYTSDAADEQLYV